MIQIRHPRPWSTKLFISKINEGQKLVYSYHRGRVRSGSRVDILEGNKRDLSIAHGFKILASLSYSVCAWISGFALDVELNSRISRSFFIMSYIVATFSCLFALFAAKFIFSQTLNLMLPLLQWRISNMIILTVQFSEVLYSCLGVVFMMRLVHKSQFLSDFVHYDCSYLIIPKETQEAEVVSTFFQTNILTLFVVPVFAIATLYDDFVQPKFFSSLNTSQFSIFKAVTLILLFIGAGILNVQHQIPVCMASFLSSSIERYLKSNVLIQLFGRGKSSSRALNGASFTSPGDRQIDKHVERYIEDYGLTTLFDDWPEVSDVRLCSKERLHSVNRKSERSLRDQLIFVYANLIKRLSQITATIDKFERKFGHLHFVSLLINGIILAQWINLSLIQSRLTLVQTKSTSSPNIVLTKLNLRMAVALLSFIASTWIMFMRFNRLPDRMIKIKSQLFKRNIECWMLHELELELDEVIDYDLIWSYYDRIEHTSKRVGFKFVGQSYYNKNCLLLVFTRGVSCVLLYAQLLDLYALV